MMMRMRVRMVMMGDGEEGRRKVMMMMRMMMTLMLRMMSPESHRNYQEPSGICKNSSEFIRNHQRSKEGISDLRKLRKIKRRKLRISMFNYREESTVRDCRIRS